MRGLPRLIIAFSGLLAAATPAALAGEPQPQVVPLSYGVTNINLLGRAVPSMAVLARRENFNAHSFDVLTVYVNASAIKGAPAVWHVVPLLEKGKEALELHASGGADCLLHDFRLIAPSLRSGARVVVADRGMGQDYATAAPVTFKFYELRRNGEAVSGWPFYYFELIRTEEATHTYCDVGEALNKELGLGQYMVRR